MVDFSTFESRIGISFKDKNLLKQAFVHRSYVNEHPELEVSHNERLEFLGDAVLELVVTDHLYKTYPEETEGELTAYRAALVNAGTLASAAGEMLMNNYLLLSRGESKDTGRARADILANTFESVIGALYLDQGYEKAEQFIAQALFPHLEKVISQKLWQDPKSKFQERAQGHTGITPSYEVIEETGPDHDKHFRVGAFLNDVLIGEGEGKSKQEAEQEAARSALITKGWMD